jgi:arabinogalactan oligomer / maltooligosaccharide transport system substrate-binding protein
MKYNPVILFVLLLISTLLAPACTGSGAVGTPRATPAPQTTVTPTALPLPTTISPSATPKRVQGTITIWHSWDESSLPAMVEIVNGFQQKYPNVLFDVLYVPAQDLKARFASEAAQGGGPTLLLGPAEWGPELYDAALLQDLQGLTDKNSLDAINQPALSGSEYKGALIGLPYALQGVVLYRNKDISTIGPATFDELTALAQSSTQGKTIGADLERSFLYSGAHLNGIGGQLMDASGKPAFNNEKGLEWIQLLKKFEEAGPPNFLNDQDLEAFKQRRVGWIIDGTWNMDTLAQTLGPDKLAIDPWPGYESGHLSGYVMADDLYLSAQAKGDPLLAAQKFIEYFISAEAQGRLAASGRIPARREVQSADPVKGELISQAMAALAKGTTYPNAALMISYITNLNIALRSIFKDNADPAQALESAESAILSDLAPPQLTPTPTR